MPATAEPLSGVEIGRVFWLRTDKPNKTDACPVSLRLTCPGHRNADISTGVTCRPEDWAGAEGKHTPLRRSHPEFITARNKLDKIKGNVPIAQARLEAVGATVTPQSIAALLRQPDRLKPGPAPCLLEFMEAELETHYAAKRNTYESIRAVVRKLRAWHGPGRLPVAEMPTTKAQAFYRHLLSAKARGGEVANANKVMAWLSALYRRGVKQTLWTTDNNPFAAVDRQAPVKRGKVRLTSDEFKRLASFDLPPGPLRDARAAFLLQFYLCGERIGACLLLRWKQVCDGRISYQAQKNGPFKEVRIRPELATLLDELRQGRGVHILPFLPCNFDKLTPAQQLRRVADATERINDGLREAAALAGIDKRLHTHACRHTFATLAASVLGLRQVQSLLGHSDPRITQVYIADLNKEEKDSAADTAFDSLTL